MADPATLAPDQFRAWVQSQVDGTVQPPVADDLSRLPLTPDTRRTIEAASSLINAGMDQNALTESNRRLGLRPGVPFNLEQGASSGIRAQLSFDPDPINQFKVLARTYGTENVDVAEGNRFVIRNQINPLTGIREDFHVNPIGAEGGDVAGMAADALPFLVGVLGTKLGGRFGTRPLTRLAGGLIGGAVGTESTAGAETALTRLFAGNEIKPGSLAYERSKAALADMAIGTAMAGGAKVLTKAGQGALGLLGVSTGDTVTTRAASELAKRTGVKYPLTPGEASESRLLTRLEATARPSIGSTGVMGSFEEGKSKAEDELRRVFLGLPRTMSDDDLAAILPRSDATGQRVLGRLGQETTRLEGEVAAARGTAERIGTAEAQRVARVNLATPLEPTVVGEGLRAKTIGDFGSFKAAMGARYDAFEANPLVSDRIVSGNPLAKVGESIERDFFPQATRTKTAPGIILGTTTTVTTTEPLDAFVSSAARRAVDELKGLAGAQVSIADMKRIRTSIDNSVAEGVAIPGTDVKQLISLRERVTDAIRTSLGKLDPALLKEWDSLGADYAKGMQRFDRLGIRRMLVKEGEQGSIGNAQLARSVASGQPGALDTYNDFKTFFGATSPEFTSVQQLARESVLKGGLDEITEHVSGNTLRTRLRALDPEVATDLFGADKKELHKIGEALAGVQGNLDLAELRRLAANGTLTASAIPALAAAERDRATVWSSKLLRASAKGVEIDADVIKPSTVVRHITQLDPDDATRILGILADRPDVVEEVRQLAVEDLWGRVQAQLKGRHGVTSGLIESTLGNDTQRRTWRRLLGTGVVDDLLLLSKVVKPQELATRVFGSAGSMRATADITRLEQGGITETVITAAERMLIATLYTGPLKQAIVNLATPINQGRLLNTIVASAPFVERVAERFGEDATGIMEALRGFVEPRQTRQLQVEGRVQGQAPLNPATLTPAEFDVWVKSQTK